MPEWEDRDSILRSAVCQPNLILSKGLVKTMGIHLIGQLCTDIKDFNPANITWPAVLELTDATYERARRIITQSHGAASNHGRGQ